MGGKKKMKIPNSITLSPESDRELIESDAYVPWTVATLREILADYPDDAPVFIVDYSAEISSEPEYALKMLENAYGSDYLVLG